MSRTETDAPSGPFRAVLWGALAVVLVGVGGYASGPVVLMARLMGTPTAILEQNSIPGMTNRVLARLADAVFTGFPATLAPKGQFVGNPVRREIQNVSISNDFRNSVTRDHTPRILILGGSRGAKAPTPMHCRSTSAVISIPSRPAANTTAWRATLPRRETGSRRARG